VDERGSGSSCDRVSLVAEVLAGVERRSSIVHQEAPIKVGQVREPVELVVHRAGIAGGGNAADGGDPECATELTNGVVDGGAHAGSCRGERGHDHLGCSWHRHPDPQAEQQQTGAGGPIGAAVGEPGLYGYSDGGDQRAAGNGDAATVHLGQMRAGSGAEQHPDRGGDEDEASRQWRVGEHELEVLRLQENRPRHGEEQHRLREALSGEAAIAEQRHVKHWLLPVHFPADEPGCEKSADRKSDGRGG